MKKMLVNNKLLVVVIIATIFGMTSGFVGEIIARVYFWEETFNVPFFTEIDFRGGNSRGSGLVIRNPRKVVVEHNEKVGEIVESVTESVVGIYKKKTLSQVDLETEKTINFDLDNYYQVSDRLGEAFIVTSDGWLISNFTPKEAGTTLIGTTSRELPAEMIVEYVIIDREKKIYDVINIVVSDAHKNSFWKITSKDLPVKEIVVSSSVQNGQMLVGVDIEGRVVQTIVGDVVDSNENLLKSTDNFKQRILLVGDMSKEYFFFNLEGGVVGFSGEDNSLDLISNYIPAIDSLLAKEQIIVPIFGISYIAMSDLVSARNEVDRRGAVVYKNKSGLGVVKDSIADRAGFVAGDVILSVNNIEINEDNDLAYVLSSYKIGDKLSIDFARNKENKKLEIVVE